MDMENKYESNADNTASKYILTHRILISLFLYFLIFEISISPKCIHINRNLAEFAFTVT